MRVRVTAHGVAARRQLANAAGIEEPARADAAGGDEEVSAPAALLERARGAKGRGAAVVEGERSRVAVAARIPQRNAAGYRVEMGLEILGSELVPPRHRSREAHRVALRRRSDVVVDQRERQAR